MRHRPQNGRLDRLTAPQTLCLHRLGDQSLPLERQLQHRSERRHNALAELSNPALTHGGGNNERPEPASAGPQQDRFTARIRGGFSETDGRPGKLEQGSQAASDQHQRVGHARSRQQQLCHLGRQVSLPPAALSLLRPAARQFAHRDGRQRCDEESAQCHPIAAAGDREPPDGRQVKEVERRGAQDRCRHPEPRSPERRHDDNAKQEHHAQRRDDRHLLQRVHDAGAYSDQHHRGDDTDAQRRSTTATQHLFEPGDHAEQSAAARGWVDRETACGPAGALLNHSCATD